MKIKNIRIEYDNNHVILVADCKIRRFGFDRVYFSFDRKYKDYICKDASPFAACLLIPSMKQGEDLIIEGAVSRKLYDGMHEIMRVMEGWNIGLKKIKIRVEAITEDQLSSSETASFFSGGVDSFYTYLKHSTDTSDVLRYFILVNGYDIDPRNSKLWLETLTNVQQIAADEGIELIEVKSNIRQLIEPILPWDYTHGGCLAAVGLCLRIFLKKIYIPSSYTASQQFPWGSHLETDKYWSTENLLFEHDGTEASRVHKVVWQVANSETALKYLRVCYMNMGGTYNCGECDKCLRTMINLLIAGKLEKCATFPHSIDLKKVAELTIDGDHGAIFHEENIAALKELGGWVELQQALSKSLKNVKVNHSNILHTVLKEVQYIDHVYFKNYLYSFFVRFLGKKFA